MAVYSLGTFVFVTLHHPSNPAAPPLLCAQQGDPMQRPGADGTSVMRLGFKGEPFPMRSFVDVETFEVANDLMSLYMAAQNAEALTLVWGGIDYQVAYSTLYLPLKVEPIRLKRVNASVGGVMGAGAGAIVEAMWTLIPISTA